MERNKILESSPNRATLTMESVEQIMSLRPREEHKEISRSFRFKPTITAERVAESVAKNNGTFMPRSIMKEKDVLTSSIGTLRPSQIQKMEINTRETLVSAMSGGDSVSES